MRTDFDVDWLLKTVTEEVREWKTLMKDLAGAFYKIYPSTRRCGWTLHLDYCAASKDCGMCPHSVFWARYFYVKLSKEKKKELAQDGHKAPNTKLSWDNSEGGTSREGLPKRLRVSPRDRALLKEFEAVRAEVMEQHKALTDLRKKLTGLQRYLPPGYAGPVSYFNDPVLKDYYRVVLPAAAIKLEVIRKINELHTR